MPKRFEPEREEAVGAVVTILWPSRAHSMRDIAVVAGVSLKGVQNVADRLGLPSRKIVLGEKRGGDHRSLSWRLEAD